MTKVVEDGIHIMNLNRKPRIEREKKTIEVMVRMYCDSHHGEQSYLCDDCRKLLDYAGKRLNQCPFNNDKPTCANCTVHCYKQDMRQRVREVMRYSGPRMTYRHPVIAFRHMIDRHHRPKGGITKWQENSNRQKP